MQVNASKAIKRNVVGPCFERVMRTLARETVEKNSITCRNQMSSGKGRLCPKPQTYPRKD
jgi:hypothetical protein